MADHLRRSEPARASSFLASDLAVDVPAILCVGMDSGRGARSALGPDASRDAEFSFADPAVHRGLDDARKPKTLAHGGVRVLSDRNRHWDTGLGRIFLPRDYFLIPPVH